jgi:hypothetical protein
MKQGFYNIVKGKFLVSNDAFGNWRFIIFLSFLALIMIASSHLADKKVHRIAQLNNTVKELKSEYLDVRKQLTQVKMESKITAAMAQRGIRPSENPPQIIRITKQQ